MKGLTLNRLLEGACSMAQAAELLAVYRKEDDVACAGMIAQEGVTLLGDSCTLTDAARIAVGAGVLYRGRLRELLEESGSGRALLNIGYDRDLDFCARLSVLDVVPRAVNGRLVL